MEGTTDVSLITGKLRTIGHVTQPEVTSTSIVPRNEAMAVTTVKAENAGNYSHVSLNCLVDSCSWAAVW